MGGWAAGGGAGRGRLWRWTVVMVVGIMIVVMPRHAAADLDLFMSHEETHRLLGECLLLVLQGWEGREGETR